MISFKVNFVKFKKVGQKEKNEVADILLKDLQQTVPIDTGQLRNGLRKRITGSGIELYIQGKRNNEVAGFLIEGTKAHFIAPRRKNGTLSFILAGRRVFSKGHMVSGIRKGYWHFKPRQRAVQQATALLNKFVKSGR